MADYLYYSSSGNNDSNSNFNMEDLLSCAVCCEPYHEKGRQPVLLPRCGHSFCRPCTAFLVKKGSIICPTCRMDQRVEGADNLPTEFSLLAISLAQQVTKQETCQSHGVKLSFWCKTCNCPACGECLFEDHPMTSHSVIKSTAYVTEMKESVTEITNKFMEALDGREKAFFRKIFHSTKIINDALRTITVLRKDMEEARDLMKGVKVVEGIAPTQTLSEAAKFLGLKWNLQDVNLNLKAISAADNVETNIFGNTVMEEFENEPMPELEPIALTDSNREETTKCETDNSENINADTVENGISEKEKVEEEKEKDEEEENLTEEEKRKRRKIQRVKERLAKASAAAELAKEETKEKIGKKEITDNSKEIKSEGDKKETLVDETKDTNSKPLSIRETYEAATKNLKPWQRRSKPWEPTPREPSITPEREIIEKSATKTIDKKPDTNEENSEKALADESAEANNNTTTDQTKEDLTKEIKIDSTEDQNTPPNAPAKDKNTIDSSKSNSSLKTENESPRDDKDESKKPSLSTIKKPRGRLARNALKRAQTMDLSKKVEDPDADTNKTAESENIKGLDLETHKTKNNEEQQELSKEVGTQTSNEDQDETATTTQAKNYKKDIAVAKQHPEHGMLEMEPEEKERIATELMQVPSLTICIEGIGGLLARVAYESMGLHIYCHQFQELPYDIIIKSNVLHAVIPTKNPMVFLDIATEDDLLGRVYISLWGHLRRANNFLLLCLGDRGRSLKMSKLFKVLNEDGPGERLLGGDYEYNDGRGGEGLLDDLEYQVKYSMPMEMGLVTSASCGNKPTDSQFYICTEEDLNRQFACPFGRVVVGLPILKEAVWLVLTQHIYIQDCGVVLDCPKI